NQQAGRVCWNELHQGEHGVGNQDMEIIFLREGANTITFKNTGAVDTLITKIKLAKTGSLASLAAYNWQLNVENLKVVAEEVASQPTQTAPPTPTYEPVGSTTYTAEYAGIYRVTSDSAVTLINETGSTATIVNPGEIAYIYLIKGENKLQTSDTSANVTFTALDGNGMSHIGKIETAYIAYGEQHVSVDVHDFVEASGSYEAVGSYLNMSPGASVTFSVTMDADGAGIIYPYLGFNDTLANTFEVTSDTGFYAEIVKPAASGSFTWNDGAAKIDMEFLYVRAGANLITIKNTGSNVATLSAFRISMTDGSDSLADHEVWGPQMNLQNLKVVASGSGNAPAPQSPDVYDTDLYTVSDGEAGSNATAVTYNGKQAIQVGSTTDSATVSTVNYSFTLDEDATYNLYMVAAAWKDINFDLSVDGTLVDYCTMHFADDVTGTTDWAYLQEQITALQLTAGDHTLTIDFYTDKAYVDYIALENTASDTYYLMNSIKNTTTSAEVYELLKEYGAAAGMDLDADT
ncbi:MAG: hypothetical protein IJ367_04850, partial [Clostridia bacterium]|nr:hypothetical protein [Clostridia bacterium]